MFLYPLLTSIYTYPVIPNQVICLYSPSSLEWTLLQRISSHNEQNLASLKKIVSFLLFCVCDSTNLGCIEHLALSGWFLHLKPHMKPQINKVFSLFSFTKPCLQALPHHVNDLQNGTAFKNWRGLNSFIPLLQHGIVTTCN